MILILLWLTLSITIHPNIAIESARNSLNLFMTVIFPSLFPFLSIINMFTKSNAMPVISKTFSPIMKFFFGLPGSSCIPYIFGIISGYPVGAIYTKNLFQKKLISIDEANLLISFSSNASPAFVIGAVGAGLIQNAEIGFFLLKIHIASSFLVGVLFRLYFLIITKTALPNKTTCFLENNLTKSVQQNNLPISNQVANNASESILSAFNTLALICGTIIIFGIILRYFHLSQNVFEIIESFSTVLNSTTGFAISPQYLIAILSGIIELSNGCLSLIPTYSCNKSFLPILSFLLGWGGLCIHYQVFCILKGTNIKRKYYLVGKFLHGIISSIIAIIFQ